jgi:putative ABC transport system ATP-binding protein
LRLDRRALAASFAAWEATGNMVSASIYRALGNLARAHTPAAGTVEALRGVSFEIPEGQFVSVTGPSGCGKSTLLNLLAGFFEPTSGRVTIAGEDLAQRSADERSDLRLRKIGFVFQAFNLLPTFSALENVAVPLEFLGVGWREALQRAAAALESVGVPGRAHQRRPTDMSGGEQQRTAIARALIADPQVLLADEPTGNLESAGGQAILDLLAELNQDRGLTVVLVTHSTFAATYGHRTIELADGRIVRDVEIRPRPRLHVVSDSDAP